LAGALLVSNASLPPFPSFFPELLIVRILARKTLWVFIFIALRLAVCYYNVFVFILMSHGKSKEVFSLSFKAIEFFKFWSLVLLTFLSLG